MGRARAYKLAERLGTESITAVYTSDRARCTETARVITPLIPDDRLREPDYGDFNELTYNEMRTIAPDIYDEWQSDRRIVHPGGEAAGLVIARGRAFLPDVQ